MTSDASLPGPPAVVTFGETMALMQASSAGPLRHVSNLELGIGGSESNFAIALKRLGTPVIWAGRTGADSLGDLIVRELTAEGLTIAVTRDEHAPTGLMIKERRIPQAVKVWYYRSGSAGSGLQPKDIPETAIKAAKVLHLTGITPALSESAAATTQHAIEIARKAGTTISFDLNYRAALWSRAEAGQAFNRIIRQANIVFAGDDEAAIAVGSAAGPVEYAERIAALGPEQVIIKRGASGCVALVDGTAYSRDAVRTSVVDTVGAGDAFVAGYISEFVRGRPVEERLTTAVRVGAFACTVPGDWEGLPQRHELDLLESTEPVSR